MPATADNSTFGATALRRDLTKRAERVVQKDILSVRIQ